MENLHKSCCGAWNFTEYPKSDGCKERSDESLEKTNISKKTVPVTDDLTWRGSEIKLRNAQSYFYLSNVDSSLQIFNYSYYWWISLVDIERTFWAYRKSSYNTATGWFLLVSGIYLMKVWGFFSICQASCHAFTWNGTL